MERTILVVDDSESVRTMVKSYLVQEGFRVVLAANGRDALFVARDEKPDLILLDIVMPELGGYEFMRIHSKEADTPIILLMARLEEGAERPSLPDHESAGFNSRSLVGLSTAILQISVVIAGGQRLLSWLQLRRHRALVHSG